MSVSIESIARILVGVLVGAVILGDFFLALALINRGEYTVGILLAGVGYWLAVQAKRRLGQ